MPRIPVRWLALSLVCLSVPVGCGSEGFTLAPVSGRVTVDGEPIEGLRVSMEPIGGEGRPLPGPDSTGITDADGRYTLATTADGRRGAVVGPCRVRILAFPGSGPDAAKEPDVITDDRDPDYDPIAEVKGIKAKMRRRGKTAKRPTGYLPLRFNDRTELTFDVPPEGSDKADFDISWK